MILLLPLSFLLLDNLNNSSEKDAKQVLLKRIIFAVGLFIGALYCTVDGMLFSAVRYPVFNLISEYIHLECVEFLLPFAVCFVPFILLFRDSFATKCRLVGSLLFGFYTIFMPYRILTRFSVLSEFMLFVKPIIILSFLIALGLCFKSLACSIEKKNTLTIVLSVFLILLSIFLPAFVESFWALNFSVIITVFAFVGYFFFSFLLCFVFNKIFCKEQ